MREEDRLLEDRLEDDYGGGENQVMKKRGLPKNKMLFLSKKSSHTFLKRP